MKNNDLLVADIQSSHFKMQLFSKSKPCRPEIQGTATDVFEMSDYVSYLINTVEAGNLASIGATDSKGHWVHIVAPKIAKDVQGNPVAFVGNSSNVQGEFQLLSVPIADLRWFPILGDMNILPLPSETGEALTEEHLEDTPLQGDSDVHFASLPVYIPFYMGNELPEGDIRSDDTTMLMSNLGTGYHIWTLWNVKMNKTELHETVLNIQAEIKDSSQLEKYIQPLGSNRSLSLDGPTASPYYIRSSAQPEIAKKIKSFFVPPPLLTQPSAGFASNFVVKSQEDEGKEQVAKLGMSKFSLYQSATDCDWVGGTVSKVVYVTYSKVVQDIISKPRASRGGLFADALQRGHRMAAKADNASIYSTLSSTVAITRTMGTNFIMGNFSIQPATSIYGEASTIDSTTYVPQNNKSKVQLVLLGEQTFKNEMNLDVPADKAVAPKTVMERLGELRSVEDFTRMMVNVVNTSTVAVDVDAMKQNGNNCMMISLAQAFINLIDGDFKAWLNVTGGGKWVHYVLFQFWDTCHSLISQFSTDYMNVNVYESGRDASELDISALKKAAIVFKSCNLHYQTLIALNKADDTVPAIAACFNPMCHVGRNVRFAQQDPPQDPNPPRPNRNNPPGQQGGQNNSRGPPQRDPPRGQRNVRRRGGRLEEPPAREPFSSKQRGMFHLRNPDLPPLILAKAGVCPDFACKGRECDVRGNTACPKGSHVFSPNVLGQDKIKLIGDKFLSDGSGWFNERSFHGYRQLDTRYQRLLGDDSGPTNNRA